MTIQISKEPNEKKVNIFKDHNQKIGSFRPSNMAEAFDWNGDEVIGFLLDTLTECNYHTERKRIEQTLNQVEL